MVEERITDGRRIAQLLASEVEGREDGGLGALSVADADREVEPTPEGARAYDIVRGSTAVACVFVHEDRARLEYEDRMRSVLEEAEDLTVREEDGRMVLEIGSGAAVKRGARALSAAGESLEGGE